MKSLNLVTTLAIAAALVMGVTGCKKTPKNVTSIPRTGVTPIADERGGGPRLGPGATGTGPEKSGTLPTDLGPGGTKIGDTTGSTGTTAFDPTKVGGPAERPQGTDHPEILAAETVYFDYDKASVKSSEVPKVQRVATYLKNQAKAALRIEGNCDERGTEEYNRSLGERRALAVRELLIASGVAPDRVTTLTNGEDKPADNGHDEAAWSKNRRAEFIVVTPESTGIQ